VYGRLPTEVELNHQSEIELPDIIQQAHIVVNGTADPYENVRVILRAARETPQLR
jgi:hypothetical protein